MKSSTTSASAAIAMLRSPSKRGRCNGSSAEGSTSRGVAKRAETFGDRNKLIASRTARPSGFGSVILGRTMSKCASAVTSTRRITGPMFVAGADT